MYKLIIELAAFLAAAFRESTKLVDFELYWEGLQPNEVGSTASCPHTDGNSMAKNVTLKSERV